MGRAALFGATVYVAGAAASRYTAIAPVFASRYFSEAHDGVDRLGSAQLRGLPALKLRIATTHDVPELRALIARSARGLSTADYRPEQVEGALRGAFGVDSQLLADKTYFVVEENAKFVGCGGWSYRSTLFGSDARAGRDASQLDPKTQAAKIRAFFVDPANARRGIATLLLEHCEREARAHGFGQVELMATLPGAKLYGQRGYVGSPEMNFDLGDGESIQFIPMRKQLSAAP